MADAFFHPAGAQELPKLPARNRLDRVDRLQLSVIIPTCNRPGLLGRAVCSALIGLPEAAEVIVVDDGSSPSAADVLTELRAANSRLQVLRNTGVCGAAGARHFGVLEARGEVILFLDDDDELLPGYANRVTDIASNNTAQYGFCAVWHVDKSGTASLTGRKERSGLIRARAPLRHKISALSAGFWIKRARFLAMGGLDHEQTIDEDTSLCCALVASGDLPWYENMPGVQVYLDHTMPGSTGAQLTRTTKGKTVLDCYLRTWSNNQGLFPLWSEARWFLAVRFLRRAAKLGAHVQAQHFVSSVRPKSLAASLWLFYVGKRITNKARHAARI